MAITAGETITEYISHIVGGVAVTGATFTVVSARDPSGTAFTPTVTEIGGGVYRVTFSASTAGTWYLLLADAAQTPDVYYENSWDVDSAASSSSSGSGSSGTSTTGGISLARLRRDVGDQIGDVLVAKATVASGSTNQFTDTVNLVHGTNTLAGRQCVLTSGIGANTGVVRLITGNTPSTGTIDVRPAFSAAPSAGNILEIYNTDAGGPRISDIDRAINRAIRKFGPSNLVEAVATAVAFDHDDPTYDIDDDWYGFIGAEHASLHDDDTWHALPWRMLDPVSRTVVIGQKGLDYGWLDGESVRLRGYTLPAQLTSDSDETNINPDALIDLASYYAGRRAGRRGTPNQANLLLGGAQADREESLRSQNLARPRLRTYYKLGAV